MKVFVLRNKYAFLILSVLFIFIAICRINFPHLDHGDEYTDVNVLNAGNNFIRFGFIKCKFLAVFEPNPNSPSDAYTHFPPLIDIINGLLRAVFHIDSLYFFRAVSLFSSFLNLIFWYFFIKLFTNNPWIALISTVFYLSNPLFIFGVDSLSVHCYSELLRSLIFFILIVLTNTQKRKKMLLFFLWALVFLESLITFEYIIYLCVFFALFKLIFINRLNNKITWRGVLILCSAPIAGFLLHLMQNAWYFGSYALALDDLTQAAVQRIGLNNNFTITFNLWLKEVLLKNISLTFLFPVKQLLFFALLSFLLYFWFKKDAHNKYKQLIISMAKLLFIFIICGISWYVFFPMHSFDHNSVTFLARHLLPAAAIAFTIFCYMLFIYIPSKKINKSWKRTLLMIVPLTFGIFIVIKGLISSELPFTPAKIKMAHNFSMFFNQALPNLKKNSGDNDTIGLNVMRLPTIIRYYTNRHCEYIATSSELIKLPQLPRYFIYLRPRKYSPGAAENELNELFNTLNEKYILTFCKQIFYEHKRNIFLLFLFELKNKNNF